MDPGRPLGVEVETERLPLRVPAHPSDGSSDRESLANDVRLTPAVTVFLAGGECPFTCVFCDLWRYTLAGPTPPGALPAQLAAALEDVPPSARGGTLKLYNASNFFDPRAVPPEDLAALARLAAPFARVVVECHPHFVGPSCFAFAEALPGRLEVAFGVETVHPEAFPRLNKGTSLDRIAAAAAALREAGIGLRAFLLVGAPFVPPEEDLDWTVRSVDWALAQGFETLALIPTRGGAGYLAELAARGDFRQPELADLERALERGLAAAEGSGAVVHADLWDLERFAPCPVCLPRRRERLEARNLHGSAPVAALEVCAACGVGGEELPR